MSVEKFSYEPQYISAEKKGVTGKFFIRETETECIIAHVWSEDRAKLLAAAPDMVLALKSFLDGDCPIKDAAKLARITLKKAGVK